MDFIPPDKLALKSTLTKTNHFIIILIGLLENPLFRICDHYAANTQREFGRSSKRFLLSLLIASLKNEALYHKSVFCADFINWSSEVIFKAILNGFVVDFSFF
jgi:hypothetical protein